MRVLFINLLLENEIIGHKNLDCNIIQALAQFSELYVACPRNWYSILPSNCKEINYKYCDAKTGVSYYVESVYKINILTALNKTYKFDIIFAMSFNIYTFNICYLLNRNRSLFYLCHHTSVDTIISYWRFKASYSSYKNNVVNVVLEEYISEGLVTKIGVDKEKILCIKHPSNIMYSTSIPYTERLFDCIGISNSNDPTFIESMVNLEKETSVFKNNNLNVVFKSNSLTYDNGALRIVKGYLDKKEYQFYVNNAKSMLVPFPKHYQFRASGTIIDALSNNIIALGSNVLPNKYFTKVYPPIVFIYKNSDELLNEIIQIHKKKLSSIEVEAFRRFAIERDIEAVRMKIQKSMKENINRI